MSELSLIKSFFNLFLVTIQNKHPRRYSYTTAYLWAKAMLKSEKLEGQPEEIKKSNNEALDKLENIQQNILAYDAEKTRYKPLPLSVVELMINKNIDMGTQRRVNIDGQEFPITWLYQKIEEALEMIMLIVTEVANRYNLDVPFQDIGGSIGNSQSMDFNKQ